MKKTHEQFKQEVFEKVGNEYTIINQYVNSKTPILMKHNICQKDYFVTPTDFLSHNNRCPYCAKNKKKTIEQFKQEVFEKVGNEYEILSDMYINNKTPILMKHNICNYEFKIQPNDFLSHNSRCPYCNGGSYKNNKKIFFEKMKKYDDYEILSKFKSENDEMTFKHILCGTKFTIKPNLFFRKKCKCPNCDNNKKTHKEFINEISKIVNLNEYIPLSEYKGYRENFQFKHSKCNNTYIVKPYRFLQGDRCPYCKKSKGEEKISKWLEDHGYSYEREFSFSDLYYKSKSHLLKFDFRILCEDSNDYILIEYDGEFHEKNKFSNESLKNQQKRDKLKDDYCKSHDNIDLYRINYKDYNEIEIKLEKIFNNYK